MKDFQILDRVSFDYHGQKKLGTVSRLNQKTVSVVLDDGGRWNVSPHLLRKIESKGDKDDFIRDIQKQIGQKSHRER